MKFKLLAAAATICAGLAMPAAASTCSAFQAGGVTPSSDCWVGETFSGNSGNDSASALNTDNVFGQMNWTNIARDNFPDNGGPDGTDEGDATALTVLGGATSGTFTISDAIFNLYSKVAVVLKAGSNNTGGWIAYEVGKEDLYNFTSVFLNNNQNPRGISHITLYGGGDTPSPVPLPAAGFMLLAGLGGLGFMSRRRRKAA